MSKALLLSVKPQYVAKILNGEKTIEVRKNKALAKAIQKLIDENGYADIYVYCTKDKKEHLIRDIDNCVGINPVPYCYGDEELNGKVIFKFRCYKVEEIDDWFHLAKDRFSKTCLSIHELIDYLEGKTGYAIHISNLEMFDRPKELKHFRKYCEKTFNEYSCIDCKAYKVDWDLGNWCKKSELILTKAPQSFMFIEVEE